MTVWATATTLAVGAAGSAIGGAISGGGDAPQMGPPPDYVGAANATAAGNLINARDATNANRPTQTTPFGSITWTRDKNGNWTQAMNYSPAQMKLLQGQNNISTSMSKRLGDYLHRANAVASGDAGKVGYDAMMARYQPQIDQSHAGLENKLANQGIMPGSEAYMNSMRTQQQGENDLRSQAAMYGQQTGMEMQRNAMGLLGSARDQAAPTGPQFNPFSQQQTVAGPDLLTAAQLGGQYSQGAYNGQVGMYNANGGALGPGGQLLGTLGSAYFAGGGKIPNAGSLFGGSGSGGGGGPGFTQPSGLGLTSNGWGGR